MNATAPGQVFCLLDSVHPRTSRVAVWSEDARVRSAKAASGRRMMIFAPAGVRVFVAALPQGGEPLGDWFERVPSARPRWLCADEDGNVAVHSATPEEVPAALLAGEGDSSVWAGWREGQDPTAALSEPTTSEDSAPRADRSSEGSDLRMDADRPIEHLAPIRPDLATRGDEPEAMPVAESGEPEGASAGEEPMPDPPSEAREPVFVFPGAGDERVAVLHLSGPEPSSERRMDAVRVFADPGAELVVVRAPVGLPHERPVVHAWLSGSVERLPRGYRMNDSGVPCDAPDVLSDLTEARLSSPPAKPSLALLVLDVARDIRISSLHAQAVPASELRAYVADKGAAPVSIRGSTGVLYASLGETASAADVQVSGQVPEGSPAHVLRVSLAAESGGRDVWFGPVGGSYAVGATALPEGKRRLSARLGPAGERIALSSSAAQRLWAESGHLSVVPAVPAVHHAPESTSESVLVPGDSTGSLSKNPAGAGVGSAVRREPLAPAFEVVPGASAAPQAPPLESIPLPDDPAMFPYDEDGARYDYDASGADFNESYPFDPTPSLQDGPPSHFDELPPPVDDGYMPPSDDGARDYEADRPSSRRSPGRNPRSSSSSRPSPRAASRPEPSDDADPAEVSGSTSDEEVRWHTVEEGLTNLGNWQSRSPRGELWVSELIEVVVDDAAQLDSLGCAVPIGALRNGFQLSRADKQLFSDVLRRFFPSRVAQVRVFEIDGRTYFSRETQQGVRLVGPRGQAVKSEKVIRLIAASYGRDPQSCFEDAHRVPAQGRGARRGTR